MRFKPAGRYSVWLLVIYFSLLGLARSASAVTAQLEIKPNRCLLEQQQTQCQFVAHIVLKASQMMPQMCLWQETQLVQCWFNISEVEYKTELSLSKTTQFYLTPINHFDSEHILAQQPVQILSQPSAKQFRRRLHSEWSLF